MTFLRKKRATLSFFNLLLKTAELTFFKSIIQDQ